MLGRSRTSKNGRRSNHWPQNTKKVVNPRPAHLGASLGFITFVGFPKIGSQIQASLLWELVMPPVNGQPLPVPHVRHEHPQSPSAASVSGGRYLGPPESPTVLSGHCRIGSDSPGSTEGRSIGSLGSGKGYTTFWVTLPLGLTQPQGYRPSPSSMSTNMKQCMYCTCYFLSR